MVWNELPSWVRTSMKSALFAVIALFIFMLILTLIGAFRNDFSCSSNLLGWGGPSSLGACFAWPLLFFIMLVVPIAVIGAVVGVIIDMILYFVRKSKEKKQ